MTIRDDAGRYLGTMDEPAPRPAGPWDRNRANLRGRDVRAALAGEQPIRPFAVFAYTQPGFDEIPGVDVYTVHGGPYDGSSVSEETLQANAIEIRGRKPADVAPKRWRALDVTELVAGRK